MSPAVSVASSCMSTILDTPSPPPRQNHGLQPQTPPPPSPPPAGVTGQDLGMHDRLQATTTPLTTASLNIPASLGIPASLKSEAVLARPGTPINPSMDAENKDMRPRVLRGKAKADPVLASTQQATPGGKRKRLTKKTKDEDNKEEEDRQRLFKKRHVACGGIAKKCAIAPTEEKDTILEMPEGFIPYVNWPPIPAKNVRRSYWKCSTINCSGSSFRVVSLDGRNNAWYPYNGTYMTREEAWASVLEYLQKMYAPIA